MDTHKTLKNMPSMAKLHLAREAPMGYHMRRVFFYYGEEQTLPFLPHNVFRVLNMPKTSSAIFS